MSSFGNCPRDCPTGGKNFDLTCALREYPELEHLLGGLDRFFNDGLIPGQFLQAVLSNDLQDAYARADLQTIEVLPRLVQLVYNHAPALAWGSPAKVTAWRKRIRERIPPAEVGP